MTDPTPKPRLSLALRVVFAVSLALNLAVLGVIAGAWWRGGPPPGPGGQASAMYRALPDDLRRDLRREMRQSIDRDAREALRVRAPLLAALRADPFDPAAVEAVLAAQAQAMGDVQARMRGLWLDRVASMTPEARAAYADRLAQEMSKRARRRD